MQLMWMSGPTDSVRTVSITAHKVLVWVSIAAAGCVLLGILLHFIGFRIAIEVSPSFARSLGGVTTEAEQQKVEASYRERLEKLRESLNSTVQDIHQLEALKNRFMDIATPVNLRDKMSKKDDAKGGPWIAPRLQTSNSQSLAQEMKAALEDFTQAEAAVKTLAQNWASQLSWLNSLPTGIPMGKDPESPVVLVFAMTHLPDFLPCTKAWTLSRKWVRLSWPQRQAQ